MNLEQPTMERFFGPIEGTGISLTSCPSLWSQSSIHMDPLRLASFIPISYLPTALFTFATAHFTTRSTMFHAAHAAT
jgi:hypothetical protein